MLGALPNISGSSSQSATQTSGPQNSYFTQDNSMVIGGGGSLTKGSMGSDAAQGILGNYTAYLVPAGIGLVITILFYFFVHRRK